MSFRIRGFIKRYLSVYSSLPVQIKASVWFLICSFLQRGISVITTPLFTRLMTTEEYGRFNVFNSWFSLFCIVIALNLTGGVFSQGLIKFGGKKEIFASAVHGLVITLIGIWLIIYVIFLNAVNNLLDLETYQVLSLFVLVGMNSFCGFWQLRKRIDYDYVPLVTNTFLCALFRPGVEIVLVLVMEDHVKARILGWVAVDVIAYFWMMIKQFRICNVFFDFTFWKYVICFNIPLVPHYLSQMVLNMSDRIMISRICGDNEAGIYSLAYSISIIMTLFNTSIINTIAPWTYQKIKSKRYSEISDIFYLSMIIISVVNVTLIIFAPEAVRIFAPKEYYEAIWVIPPVAISAYFTFLYSLISFFEFYFEKTKYLMIASVMAAVLNIVLNCVFIRLFGYVAAGYTTLICYILYAICHYYCYRRIRRESFPDVNPISGKKVLSISICTIVAGLILLLTYNNSLIRYCIAVLMIVAVIITRNNWLPRVKQVLYERKSNLKRV